MKLTVKQIEDIALGVSYVDETDRGVMLHRFTKEQEELYKVTSDDFYKKTFATSGIRLDLMTDSSFIGLEVQISYGSSRKYFQHSIFVNGVKYSNLGCAANSGQFSCHLALPEGENRVTVYFPWSVCSSVKSLELDDGASLTPVKRSRTMICFGDSITHGYDASSPELSYASKLTDALDAYAINKGIGGEIFRPALAKSRDDISPDYITVAYGTNDWSHCEKEKYEANCREFYEALSENYPDSKIFAITPIWRKHINDVTKMGSFAVAAEIIEKVVAPLPNVTVINGLYLVPHDLSCFSPDGVHPNDKGFSHYADNLVEEIKKQI